MMPPIPPLDIGDGGDASGDSVSNSTGTSASGAVNFGGSLLSKPSFFIVSVAALFFVYAVYRRHA